MARTPPSLLAPAQPSTPSHAVSTVISPDKEAARARLRGTVWERSGLAVSVYQESIGLGRRLGAIGVTPDAITYASLGLAALAGVAAAIGWLGTAAFFVLASGLADVLDGVVARATGRSSPFGALLDSTINRLSDGLPLLGLVVFYAGWGPAVLAPGAALLAGFTVSYIRARAEGLGARLPALYMRRAERVVMLVASLLGGAIPVGGPVPAPLTLAGVAILAVLGAFGAVSAIRAARTALTDLRVG
ncbi:MAG: CDP-alcohol phosphatidyltransferase family protein [Minicystis sp.]